MQSTPLWLSRSRAIALRLGSLLFWLVLWQLAAMAAGHEILVPKPLTVARELISLSGEAAFWNEIAGSLMRVLAGFFLALAAGIIIGTVMHLSKTAAVFISTPLSIIKATPVPSFIILALIWIKSGFMPVFISFLMVLPTVCLNVSEGLSQVDGRLIEMMKLYRASWLKRVSMLYVPSLAPYLTASFRSGLALAWKAGISAEVIGRTAGSIGKQLYESKLYLETGRLFAYTVTVIVLSRVLEMVIITLAQRAASRVFSTGRGADSDEA